MQNVISQRKLNASTAHIRQTIRETLNHTGAATVELNIIFVPFVEKALSITCKRNVIS